MLIFVFIFITLIFVYGVTKCSNFIFFSHTCPVSTAPLIEEIIFSLLDILASSVIVRCPEMCGFIPGLAISLHWSVFLFLCQYHTALITVLCGIMWSQGAWFLQLHSSFLSLFSLFRVFCISMQSVNFLFLFCEKCPW